MLPAHSHVAPDSIYIDKEKIELRKLDNILEDYYDTSDNVLLKIDSQGYEKYILEGASHYLKLIRGIQLEMSLIPLYEDSLLFSDMIKFMEENEFRLYSIENGFHNLNTGQQLQIDGTFYRTELF